MKKLYLISIVFILTASAYSQLTFIGDPNPSTTTQTGNIRDAVKYKNMIYYSAYDGILPNMWRADVNLSNIEKALANVDNYEIAASENYICFAGYVDEVPGIYLSDGTKAGTELIYALNKPEKVYDISFKEGKFLIVYHISNYVNQLLVLDEAGKTVHEIDVMPYMQSLEKEMYFAKLGEWYYFWGDEGTNFVSYRKLNINTYETDSLFTAHLYGARKPIVYNDSIFMFYSPSGGGSDISCVTTKQDGVLVYKDTLTGFYDFNEPVLFNDTLYFTGLDKNNNDGLIFIYTSSGGLKIKNIFSHNIVSSSKVFIQDNQLVAYFQHNDGVTNEIMVYTPETDNVVIYPTTISLTSWSLINKYYDKNGIIIFRNTKRYYKVDLADNWNTTQLSFDIKTDEIFNGDTLLVAMDSTGLGYEAFLYDVSEDGLTLFEDFNKIPENSHISGMTKAGNRWFFEANRSDSPNSLLWYINNSWDGITNVDLEYSEGNSSFGGFRAFNNKIYFESIGGSKRVVMYSDGTGTGSDTVSQDMIDFGGLIKYGDRLFGLYDIFEGEDKQKSFVEILPNGSTLLVEQDSNIYNVMLNQEQILFLTDTIIAGDRRMRLQKSDATPFSKEDVIIFDADIVKFGYGVFGLQNLGVFSIVSETGEETAMQTDGTAANTKPVFIPGSNDYDGFYLFFSSENYFSIRYGNNATYYNLISDGNDATNYISDGTLIFKDSFIVLNDRVLVVASDPGGDILYAKPAGSNQLVEVKTFENQEIYWDILSEDKQTAYYLVWNKDYSAELWKTDGTIVNTTLVTAFIFDGLVEKLLGIDDTTLFISAKNNMYGDALYKFALPSVVEGPEGIEQIGSSNSLFTIYPNPSNGIFNVSLGGVLQANIEVKDLSGRNVFVKAISGNNNYSFDISEQANGIYILNIVTNEYRQVIKLVKY